MTSVLISLQCQTYRTYGGEYTTSKLNFAKLSDDDNLNVGTNELRTQLSLS